MGVNTTGTIEFRVKHPFFFSAFISQWSILESVQIFTSKMRGVPQNQTNENPWDQVTVYGSEAEGLKLANP